MFSTLDPVVSPASNELAEETPRLTKDSSLSDFVVRLRTSMPEVWTKNDVVNASDFVDEVIGLLIQSGHINVEEMPEFLEEDSDEMLEFSEDYSDELPEFSEDCSNELPEFVENLPKVIDRPYTIGAVDNSFGFLLKSISYEREICRIDNIFGDDEEFETNTILITVVIAIDGARVPFEFETRRIYRKILNPTGERKGHIHEVSCTGRKVAAINGKTFITLYGYEYINND